MGEYGNTLPGPERTRKNVIVTFRTKGKSESDPIPIGNIKYAKYDKLERNELN